MAISDLIMNDIITRPVGKNEIAELISLWERTNLVRPSNDPATDIALAQAGENSDVLVGIHDEIIVSSVMVGHDGHREWVYYVAVDAAYQRKGLGRVMMDEAEKWLRLRGIPKMNLLVRLGNQQVTSFYESLGYQSSEVVCLQKVMG